MTIDSAKDYVCGDVHNDVMNDAHEDVDDNIYNVKDDFLIMTAGRCES